MSKFTPGPWRYEASTKTIRSEPANYWLATMDSWDGAVNHEANAALIAAAPDIYAALQDITSAYERALARFGAHEWGMLTVETARAALAKADGK